MQETRVNNPEPEWWAYVAETILKVIKVIGNESGSIECRELDNGDL